MKILVNLHVKSVVQMIVILIVEENARGVVQTPVHQLVDTPVQVVVLELQNQVAHLALVHVRAHVIQLVPELQNQVAHLAMARVKVHVIVPVLVIAVVDVLAVVLVVALEVAKTIVP